jgi:hypothetical protein
MAVYLGLSPDHATSVPLVLNTTTGLISPQYHVVFDSSFSTTKCLQTNEIPINWPDVFKTSEVNLLDPDQYEHHKLDPSWSEPSQAPLSTKTRKTTKICFIDELDRLQNTIASIEPNSMSSSNEREFQVSPIPPISSIPNNEGNFSTSSNSPISSLLPNEDITQEPHSPSITTSNSRPHGILLSPKATQARDNWNPNHNYSTRFKKTMTANVAALESTLDDNDVHLPIKNLSALLAEQEAIYSDTDGTIDLPYQPFAFATADNDSLQYGQMRKDADRSKFEEDMQREVSDLLSSNSVKIVKRASMPANTKPDPAIWSFHRKRAPDWTITKWKARLCPHGGKQIEGVDFWETHAPVVACSAVRLVLILSMISGMKSRQVDYIQAYTQAPIDCEIYMCIPAQFIVQDNKLHFSPNPTLGNSDTYVLLLTKNLYGLRQAGNNWLDKLRDSLHARGFQQSSIDPCLFIRKNAIIIVYIDDCLLFARTDKILDDNITSLQSDFNLTYEGDVGAFLGIQFTRNNRGHIEMTQTGLIAKIIKECGLDSESKRHKTPPPERLFWTSEGASVELSNPYRYANLLKYDFSPRYCLRCPPVCPFQFLSHENS